ncbi:RagB/SusD family nutrient uptake outer membrane protein [Flavobacterium sp. DG1-102-2]|uniref:RagB/SusD family nutrient uptake outer membrane protein n=1 Tax=Flavobacterium sp. DG1-102-2 TaxID=3081663 RepID=UPI002949C233|nr:RagB/SusD family nutrient uptake outer membrane protein [Flavobacterium sp. DG1-102-2]MDV6166881.1 RagB/SusD family nutrient uptake outer membrane protein [Flavobacterium sp. DG1-102-2]
MKFKTIFKKKIIITACAALALAGCTNLDETILDAVPGEESSDAAAALAAAYDRLGDRTFTDNGGMIAMQEYSSDIALLPTRGSDWGDGGKWRAMHEFTWAPDNAVITDNWTLLTNGITRSLTAIRTIEASTDPQKALFLAEAKVLLAFYTYTTLDLYGQAPYKDPSVANAPLVILKADTAIDDVIKNVEAALPDLAELGTQRTHNGRVTKEAAYAMLAQMYLNRAVYKDRYNASSNFNFNEPAVDGNGTDMDKVISYSNLLINSGKFSLASNYFDSFSINNDGAKELIFAITQKIDKLRDGDNDLAYMSVERNQRVSAGNRGTNGSCITPEFYASWDGNHDDPRFQRHYQYADGTWFMNDGTTLSVPATDMVPGTTSPWFHFNRGIQFGQQYGPKLAAAGGFEKTADGRIKVSALVCEKSTTTPMDFTPALNFDNPTQSVLAQNQINRGARCFKFEFDPGDGANNGTSKVDIPLFRLGGIYTMRAEAYLRKGETGLALADVNILRTSRTRESLFGSVPGTPIAAISADVLYKEIGFEMYWEMWRRPQMVRFGKLDLALPESAKPATPPYKRIFPIPQGVLDVTKGFTQNTGYVN